jgi:hypothetical protein
MLMPNCLHSGKEIYIIKAALGSFYYVNVDLNQIGEK